MTQTVQDLKKQIELCQKCPLRLKISQDEVPYFGVGSADAKVMLVINPPSKEFSQLVDGIVLEYLEQNLKKFNIKKGDLYITPYVKCRTAQISKSSIVQCDNWLQKEIEIFQPKAVFVIGTGSKVKLVKIENRKHFIVPHSLWELATNSKTKLITDNLFASIWKIINDKVS